MRKTNYLKSAYTELSSENLDNLIGYLKQIGGKPLTTKCKRQNAFKISWTEKETKLQTRCHVQNAVEYLIFIKDSITKRQLQTVIADIADYVEYLDSNEDTSFILISTNTLPSAIQFDSAKRLFYNHQIREQNQNNYSTDLLTLYAIRLSLESRVRGLLGIDYATNNGKNIGLSTFIKIAKGLKYVEYSSNTEWTEIEWVNNWLNHHMHRHLRPYPWIIHQALEVLRPFVDPKEPLIKSNRTIHSFYSATYVVDESALQKEIEATLKELYSKVQIRWLDKREIVKKK
ncbi:hypothetical protein [Cellulophaga sp. HaHa_2_1]|uniref:hypothetical protein n=1 Tax=Cellulophaga sp. HaHa_2_1 TaxID=2749994 RepID=UPI001C4FC876|nr:hypothetical protein [Cellulophaga sp. HaHa_2_1]QXP52615.1 hypothetical protein H0I24_01440 [Cellulophaga sp. HaHa_2_1]